MIRAFIVTISDGVAAGTREDRSGAELVKQAGELGWTVAGTKVVPDEIQQIAAILLGDGAASQVLGLLQEHHFVAVARQSVGGSQAGEACSDDRDRGFSVWACHFAPASRPPRLA